MRRSTFFPCLCLLSLLAACGSTKPYTSQDLYQVRQTFHRLVPVYVSFSHAYLTHNGPLMTRDFHEEQRICKEVDVIDKRDSIDPNVNLFAVSAGMDELCNEIEQYYAAWRKSQGLPYDRTMAPVSPTGAFATSAKYLAVLRKQLASPSQLT